MAVNMPTSKFIYQIQYPTQAVVHLRIQIMSVGVMFGEKDVDLRIIVDIVDGKLFTVN
jgi:hypothetical protein